MPSTSSCSYTDSRRQAQKCYTCSTDFGDKYRSRGKRMFKIGSSSGEQSHNSKGSSVEVHWNSSHEEKASNSSSDTTRITKVSPGEPVYCWRTIRIFADENVSHQKQEFKDDCMWKRKSRISGYSVTQEQEYKDLFKQQQAIKDNDHRWRQKE